MFTATVETLVGVCVSVSAGVEEMVNAAVEELTNILLNSADSSDYLFCELVLEKGHF